MRGEEAGYGVQELSSQGAADSDTKIVAAATSIRPLKTNVGKRGRSRSTLAPVSLLAKLQKFSNSQPRLLLSLNHEQLAFQLV